MPEGPEVRTVADKIRPVILNTILIDFACTEKLKLISGENFLPHSKILAVRSYGKKLIFDTDKSFSIIFSLGMSGRLQYEHTAHTKAALTFKNEDNVFNIYFNDVRGVGSNINMLHHNQYNTYMSTLGPDILQASMTEYITREEWLLTFTSKTYKNNQICVALMEQSAVAGIGNYLVNEILYYSGIHPLRRCVNLSHEELDTIRINAHKIIYTSYSYGGFTLKDFISPDGHEGNYPAGVYDRRTDDNGNQVLTVSSSKKRTCHYVPVSQK